MLVGTLTLCPPYKTLFVIPAFAGMTEKRSKRFFEKNYFAKYNQVSKTLSGFNDTLSIPCCINHLARSG